MSNTFKGIVITLLVAMLLIVAWNPIIAPTGRAVGRFVGGGWAAMTAPEPTPAITVVIPNGATTNGDYIAAAPLTQAELDAQIAERCDGIEVTENTVDLWVTIDGIEYECPGYPKEEPTAPGNPVDEAPDGPRYEEAEVGFNVWGNGQKIVWNEVPEPEGEGQYLVAHGDLKADGKASIKAFVSVLEAKKYLKDGTWKLNLVTVVETGSVEEYLDALAERLGEDYKIQP